MLKQIEDLNEVRCAGQEGIYSDVTGDRKGVFLHPFMM